jgi:8-oxo-dGTP pyrophosphatase MutT (NUDIX family)
MVRRNEALTFLGGYYVFPGGALEAEDLAAESLARCRGVSPEAAESIIRSRSGVPSLGYWVGALRELFEETGVLVAVDRAGRPIRPAPPELETLRRELIEGKASLTERLSTEDWYYDSGSLRYVSHWVTPPGMSRRYDTRFFLCPEPQYQGTTFLRGEHIEACWISPRDALKRLNRAEMPISEVTEIHLHDLMGFGSWDSLWSQA